MIGKQELVLVEKINGNGIAQGYGEHYIPIRFKDRTVEKNCFYSITIDSIDSQNKLLTKGSFSVHEKI